MMAFIHPAWPQLLTCPILSREINTPLDTLVLKQGAPLN